MEYDTIAKISAILYGLMLISLVAVLFTTPISGATSWFTLGSFSIQPSEFAKIITKYVADLDEVVKRYIPKEPAAKKGEPVPPTQRSIKYYKHALEIKGSRNLTIKQIEDYSRIMLCLYMGAIDAGMKEVGNYEFSTEGLNLEKIISALKAEKPGIAFPIGKKTMFNLEDLYCTDTVTFVITMITFCHIKNLEVKGEY